MSDLREERGMVAVPDDLKPLLVPVDSLRSLPGNPRRGDVDAVAESLARFGQRKPIVVDADGTILAGNHTWQAAKRLQWEQIAVVRVDDDTATGRAFALADNRTGDLGGYDDQALLELLDQVGIAGLEGTGYDSDDLEALAHLLMPPDLDALADDIGDMTDDDRLVRVVVKLPAELAERMEDALGSNPVPVVQSWLGVE